jgi:hypothetical protein
MNFVFARAQHDAYLLQRMEAREFGLRLLLEAPEDEPEPEHRHGDHCSCTLRGE